MKTIILTIEVTVEVEAEYSKGKDAVMPHAGNTDGTPPEGPEVKIKKILLPAESSKQVDILPFIDASTLVEIEDDYLEVAAQDDD